MAAPAWLRVGLHAGSGMKTSVKELRSFGWRPLVMLLSETVWMAALVLILILVGIKA